MSTELERLLREAGRRLPAPDPAATGRARAGILDRGRGLARTRRVGRAKRRLSVVLAVAAALGLASAIGFGVGYGVGPRGGHAAAPAGPMFLVARGWNTLEIGITGTSGSLTAIAANVPFADEPGRFPVRTIRTLPPNGVVVAATLYPAVGGPTRVSSAATPLRLADAAVVRRPSPKAPLVRRLATSVAGHDVDIHLYFGSPRPSRQVLEEAQLELSRFVAGAAPDDVTIAAAQPVAVAGGQVEVGGGVANQALGEQVLVEARDCGSRWFRVVGSAATDERGRWSLELFPETATVLRAKWNGTTSTDVAVTVHPRVLLERERDGRLAVGVAAPEPFDGRTAIVQRFVALERRWVRVRAVELRSDVDPPGTMVGYSAARFRVGLPAGTAVRVVVPDSQTGPCFLAGVSNTVRTA